MHSGPCTKWQRPAEILRARNWHSLSKHVTVRIPGTKLLRQITNSEPNKAVALRSLEMTLSESNKFE